MHLRHGWVVLAQLADAGVFLASEPVALAPCRALTRSLLRGPSDEALGVLEIGALRSPDA
jgi:hypothetical protein